MFIKNTLFFTKNFTQSYFLQINHRKSFRPERVHVKKKPETSLTAFRLFVPNPTSARVRDSMFQKIPDTRKP